MSKFYAYRWDLVVIGVLILFTIFYNKVPPHIRPTSLTDPSLQYPHLPDIISGNVLKTICFTIPIIIIVLTQFRNLQNNLRDFALISAISVVEINMITIASVSIFKHLVGRQRPFFASVCESYIADTFECTGDASEVKDARMSFPSGHAAISSCSGMFLMLYLAVWLQLSKPDTPSKSGKIIIAMFPMFLASLVAVSRLVDYHHHYADVAAGGLIGVVIGCFGFFARRADLLLAIQDGQADGSPELYQPLVDESC